jgi:hypothetical protein
MEIRKLQKLGGALVVAGAVCMGNGASAQAASDADIEALKAQIAQLTEKVTKLEQENVASREAATSMATLAPAAGAPTTPGAASTATTAPAAPAPVMAGAQPGSFKLPGSDTSVKIGGSIKLDTIYDFNGATEADQMSFVAIPLRGVVTGNENEFRMHGRESRLNIETNTPTSYGNLKTFLEADFYGTVGTEISSNGSLFRLRQAYAEWGPWLFGQTWSNFTDVPTNVPTVDFTGTAGRSSVRQAMAMYTARVADRTNLSLSIENPFGDVQTDTGAAVTNIDDTPDIIAKLLTDQSWGRFVVRGMGGRFDVRSAGNREQTAGRYGVGFATKLKVFDKDAIFLDATYGKGVGRYLNDAGNEGAAFNITTNSISPQIAYGGYAAYQHQWNDQFSSNLMYGILHVDNPSFLPAATSNKLVESVHANLFWVPHPKAKIGLEYIYGFREVENGATGHMNRAQAGIWYFF